MRRFVALVLLVLVLPGCDQEEMQQLRQENWKLRDRVLKLEAAASSAPAPPPAPKLVDVHAPVAPVYLVRYTEAEGTCGAISPHLMTVPFFGEFPWVGLACERKGSVFTCRGRMGSDDTILGTVQIGDASFEAIETATRRSVLTDRPPCRSTWKIRGDRVESVVDPKP